MFFQVISGGTYPINNDTFKPLFEQKLMKKNSFSSKNEKFPNVFSPSLLLRYEIEG